MWNVDQRGCAIFAAGVMFCVALDRCGHLTVTSSFWAAFIDHLRDLVVFFTCQESAIKRRTPDSTILADYAH
jgi:hypothetical protein